MKTKRKRAMTVFEQKIYDAMAMEADAAGLWSDWIGGKFCLQVRDRDGHCDLVEIKFGDFAALRRAAKRSK